MSTQGERTTTFHIICISRSTGAYGEQVGRLVADQLGFRYVDEEVVTWAAQRVGVSAQLVDEVEHSQTLIARILNTTATAGAADAAAWSEDAARIRYPPPIYQGIIREVIRETAETGDVVIVAHAASIPLAGMPGLLRVWVTASPDVRAARLRAASDVPLDQRQATAAIAESDRERRAYLKRFYKVTHELPTHYDLVINTDVLTPALAAHVIVSAASALSTAER